MKPITYKTMLLSKSQEIFKQFQNFSESVAIDYNQIHSIMDALEYLMDTNIDSIVIDWSIEEDDLIKFLEFIQDDFENKQTPIILLSDQLNYTNLSNKVANYNVIAIYSNTNWHLQVEKLLLFFKMQKTNIAVLENSLMKSEDTSTKDNLTGAYNRYGCEDIFTTLTSRYKAYQESFCAIMMDIDHFKKVNDKYGHDIGDEVLISFSNIVHKSIRKTDAFIRLGGEEFIIFLSNVDLKIASKNAEKLRLLVEIGEHSSKNLKISSSFGVVLYEENEDLTQIIKRSDELLYEAKATGRNKVITQQ